MHIFYWDQSREPFAIYDPEMEPLYPYWEATCKKNNLRKIWYEWGIEQGIDRDYLVELIDEFERFKIYLSQASPNEIPPDIVTRSLNLIERMLGPLQEAKDHWEIVSDIFF